MDVAGLVTGAHVAVGTVGANRLALSRGMHRIFLLEPLWDYWLNETQSFKSKLLCNGIKRAGGL